MPPQIDPMLIHDITAEGKDWVDKNITKDKYILQHKINGMRFILVIDPDGTTHMSSRSKSVKTFRFSELDDRVLGLKNIKSPFEGRVILDGEIIMPVAEIDLPSGVHTTSTLQSTVSLMHLNVKQSLELQEKYGSLQYKVFDILMINGQNVELLPYEERAELVVTVVNSLKRTNPNISMEAEPVISDYESAWDLFEEYTKNQGGEGLVLKERNAPYEQGKRVRTQLKLKAFQTVDGFITGFVPSTKGKGNDKYIGGFIFSAYVDGKRREIAAVANIDNKTRIDATVYDEQGEPTLNPIYLNKCAALLGQDWNQKTLRLNSARIEEWRDDKTPEECQVSTSEMKFNTSI